MNFDDSKMTQTLVSNCLSCSYLSKVYFSIAWLTWLTCVTCVTSVTCVLVFFLIPGCISCAVGSLKQSFTPTSFCIQSCFIKIKRDRNHATLYWRSMHFIEVPKTGMHFWRATSKNACMLKSANLEIHEFSFKEHAFWKFGLVAKTKFCTYYKNWSILLNPWKNWI